MLRLVAGKLIRLIPVLFIVSLATFFMLELTPGDPAVAVLGSDASPAEYDRVTEQLGLDKPAWERYTDWLGNALQGDFGESLARPGLKVSDRIQQNLPVTMEIALLAMGMAIVVSIPLGAWTAFRAGSRFDRATSAGAFAIISIPSFLAALLLIYFMVFNSAIPRYLTLALGLSWALWLLWRALRLRIAETGPPDRRAISLRLAGAVMVTGLTAWLVVRWPSFPRQGFVRWTSEEGVVENLRTAFLPSLTIALAEIAVFTRLLRSDMMSTLQEDYILSARAKGMPSSRIVFSDALRPSSFSLVTLAGVAFGRLIGGTVIVETVFNLPGMGTLLVNDGVNTSDYTIVQAGVLVLATFYVLLNAFVDVSYSYLDPRIRRGRV